MKIGILELLEKTNIEFGGDLIDGSIEEYVDKIIANAEVVCHLSKNQQLAGFIAYYANNTEGRKAFLTMLCVDKSRRSEGIGKGLVNYALSHLRMLGFISFSLEVLNNNLNAIKLYESYGFVQVGNKLNKTIMCCTL